MNPPVASILLPVRNAMPYLKECLESIISQSFIDWELIAVNDHSTDESSNLLQEYQDRFERIKYFDNDGIGIIPALRKAFSHSSGNLITRMDADDIMTTDRLEIMKAQLQSHGQGHVASGQVKYFSNTDLGNGYTKYQDWLNSLISSGSNYSEIYKECVIPSPCWMLYRNDLESIGAFNSTRYPEDYDLCFRMYDADLRVIPNQKVLHYWRDYANRTSRTDDNYSDNRFLDLKIYYFLKIDYQANKPLVIWGAGKKGKQIAKILIDRTIDFFWICENHKKVGKEIYNIHLQSTSILYKLRNPQVIVAVAGEAQNEIRSKMPSDNKAFYFC